jgi:hypothetical protein
VSTVAVTPSIVDFGECNVGEYKSMDIVIENQVHVLSHTQKHTHAETHAETYTHTHTHIHTHTHTYTHTHTHLPSAKCRPKYR